MTPPGARLLEGGTIADEIRTAVAEDVATFTRVQGRAPGLRVVIVGKDAPSTVYLERILRGCAKVGIDARDAVVIGRSAVVGMPAAFLLVREDATVTVCHSRTRDLAGHVRRADIVVVAAGVPGLVTGAMLKPGAVVVDVGINVVDGRIVGDVDFESARAVASA